MLERQQPCVNGTLRPPFRRAVIPSPVWIGGERG